MQTIDIKVQNLSTYHLIDSDSKGLFQYNSASPHQKSMPSMSMGMDLRDSGVLERGSMYQSSKDVRRTQRLSDGKKNAEPGLNDDAFISFEVIDSSSWCSSNESIYYLQSSKDPLLSLNVETNSPSVANGQSVSTKNMEFLDLSFRDLPDERSKISISCSDANPADGNSADSLLGMCLQTEEINSLFAKAVPELVEKLQVKEIKCARHQLLGTKVDAHIIHDKDAICILPKSFSAKPEFFNSSYHSEGEIMKSSPKTHFNPFMKMLDPIMKSKSLRNPSLMEPEPSSSSASDAASLSRHKIFPRSLLIDSSKAQKIDNDRESSGSDQFIKAAMSPVHLHAILKWEFNHGGPSYEFLVNDPEDVLCAKTWKSENAYNWVYTFHCSKMKSNSIGRRIKDRHVHPSLMIGQMQVSCYLCSEVSEAGLFENSVVTEFTMYDIAQARRNMSFERPDPPLDSNQASIFTVADTLIVENASETNNLESKKHQNPVRLNSIDYDTDPSASYPWALTELHPNLEIAAIVIQIPFSKKEALTNMQMRDVDNGGYKGLFITSAADQQRGTFVSHPSSADVKVVTPSGSHGLPNREEVGPSSLLNRWRSGGGCDCGGWDMGCPIVVFDTANAYNVSSATGTQQPIVLFVKGKKEKIPALTMTANGKGQYAVDFHAQLSALQAFSICIAVLHSSEASSAIGHDKNNHNLSSNSLKLLLEDEVRHIIEAVAEEKRKAKKRVELVPPSFSLDPPFSPMGRV